MCLFFGFGGVFGFLFFVVWYCFDTGWPLDGFNGMVHEFGSGRHRAREFRNGEYGKEFRERLTLPFPKTFKVRNP